MLAGTRPPRWATVAAGDHLFTDAAPDTRRDPASDRRGMEVVTGDERVDRVRIITGQPDADADADDSEPVEARAQRIPVFDAADVPGVGHAEREQAIADMSRRAYPPGA